MSSRPARKQTVSITLESDLVRRARDAKLSLSSVSAEAILAAVKKAESEKIRAGIQQDMNWYADLLARHGCPAAAARDHFGTGDEAI